MSGTVGTNAGRGSGSIGTAATGATVSASDPALDTNATLGTQWANSTSGEFYICTDATTDENVWTNVDAAGDSIAPFKYQGTAFGFLAGGHTSSYVTIQKVSFTTATADATDLADTSVNKSYAAGYFSATHGFVAGGNGSSTVEKYAFVSTANSASIGDLTDSIVQAHGNTDGTYGWVGSSASGGGSNICKHTFSSDARASTSSNYTVAREAWTASSSSNTHGYACGGIDNNSDNAGRSIERVTFASEAAASSGTSGLLYGGYGMAGQCSQINLYVTCGYRSGFGYWSDQQKRALSSEGTMSISGSMTQARETVGGMSYTTHGYAAGGHSGSAYVNRIDRFTFDSDAAGTDVGNMVVSVSGPSPANY